MTFCMGVKRDFVTTYNLCKIFGKYTHSPNKLYEI